MITIYFSSYEIPNNQNKYQVEHQLGLFLLSYGLSEQLNIKIDEQTLLNMLDYGKYGKPYLKNYPSIFFNISHCDGLVGCVISDKEIGFDIEKITKCNDLIIKKVLTDNEQKILSHYKNEEYKEMFYRFWTLKESYLKWDGSGFSKDPKNISLRFNKDMNQIKSSELKVNFYQEKIMKNYFYAICLEDEINEKDIKIRWIIPSK